MKTTLSILLAASLAAMNLQAQTNTAPVEPKSALVVGFCLTIMLVAGAVIVYVYTTTPGPGSTVTLVLDESTDGRATWHPVATNTVTLIKDQPKIEFFRKAIDGRDPSRMNFYQTRIQR